MQRIFLTGFMGAGKTTLGQFMAKKHNLSFIDLDSYIEKQHGKSINELFSEYGEDKFRLLEKNALEEVSSMEDIVIATGGGTPCFHNNMKYMSSKGITVFLNVPAGELHKRLIAGKSGRPLLKDKNEKELLSYINEQLNKRLPFYNQSSLKVDATDLYTEEDIASLSDKVVTLASNLK